jgi:magnesium-transporting ATPase (P-type)
VSNASTLHSFQGPTSYVQCIVEWNFRNKIYSLKSPIRTIPLKDYQKDENVIYAIIVIAAVCTIALLLIIVAILLACQKKIKKQGVTFRKPNIRDKDQENKTLCSKIEDPNSVKVGEMQSMV